jgi:hypothetical protein
MEYNTTPHKIRENYKRVNQNEIDINNLNNTSLRLQTINFRQNVYTYETEWTNWNNASSDNEAFTSVLKLENFPEMYIPFISSQLILKTIENDDGIVNQDYIDQTDNLLDVDLWEYSYIIRKAPFSDDSQDNTTHYLISRIWFNDLQTLPFDYRELITINLPKSYEVRNNSS